MTVREAVWQCCIDSGISLSKLAAKVGMSKGNLSRSLSTHDGMGIRTDILIKLLDALDAQVLVQTLRDDEYIVDGEEEGVLDEYFDKSAFPDM